MIFPSIKSLNLNKKRVFLRSDLNVPVLEKQILQDFKLKATLQTVDFILKSGGKIILGSHIGRPEAKNKTHFYDDELSTQILIPWFENKGYKIQYQQDLLQAETQSHVNQSSILLLENLRFFSGEKEYNLHFAELLAETADVYVNDAFGVIHREDTSVTLLAKQFDKNHKGFGFLVEQELQNLEKIRNNTSKNFVLVIGGIKLKDKLPLLKKFMQADQQIKPRSIIVGGALGLAFLQIRENLALKFDAQTLDMADQIKEIAILNKINLLLPVDQIIFKNNKVETVKITDITPDANCIDIGPETINNFSQEIRTAQVIFCNGTMGIYTQQDAKNGTQKILQAIADSNAFKVIGGGDATAAACMFNLENKMSFLSTGGGATLKYLSCKNPKQEMPGLNAMIHE